MSLEQQIMTEMKEAMKSKNEATLRGLRAIKAEIIKAKTEPGAGGEITSEKETSLLQKNGEAAQGFFGYIYPAKPFRPGSKRTGGNCSN